MVFSANDSSNTHPALRGNTIKNRETAWRERKGNAEAYVFLRYHGEPVEIIGSLNTVSGLDSNFHEARS